MNLKALIEKRNAKIEELEDLSNKVSTEERAFTEDENKLFASLEEEVKALTDTINKIKELENNGEKEEVPAEEGRSEENEDETKENEERAFANYIRGVVSERANLDKGTNGAVIPKTIAQRIIDTVYDISPILQRCDFYKVKGNLDIPVYDETTDSITVAYADEFSTLTAHSGKFISVSLKGFLAASLTLISKSLINNTDHDLVSFVVNKIAEKIVYFIDHEVLVGTQNKIEGMRTLTNTMETASASAITADELVTLMDKVKDIYKNNAIWIMSSATRTAIRKLKGQDQHYLLQDDITSPFGQVLLGKPVYVSDAMPDMGAGNKEIFFGDMSGLAIKMPTEVEIEVLREKYADQHAIGINAWIELDSKVANNQKIAGLVGKTTT